MNATDPAVRWPGTTWEVFAPGRVLIGAGTGTDVNGTSMTFAVGATGGEYSHQLTVGELAEHAHGTYGQNPRINDNVGGTSKWGHDPTLSDWWFQTCSQAVMPTGSNQYHNNVQPFAIIRYYQRTK